MRTVCSTAAHGTGSISLRGREHRLPSGPPPPRTRARALGIEIGTMPPGPTNSIVDVADVAVGHATVWFDEPAPPAGRGRRPHRRDRDRAVLAGRAVPSAACRSAPRCSTAPVSSPASCRPQEWGSLETPILLTRTMGVGRVYDGVVDVMLAADPAVGRRGRRHPDGRRVRRLVAERRSGGAGRGGRRRRGRSPRRAGADGGPVVEGAVGAGTGMCCLGFKGGIGSASRQVAPTGYRLGALVLVELRRRRRRSRSTACPVGRDFVADGWQFARDEPAGSCIVVLATDAPMTSHQLERLARARRARSRAHRFGRAPRQRRDLRRVQHRDADAARRRDTSVVRTATCCRDEALEPVLRRRGRSDRGSRDQQPRRRRHRRRPRRPRRHRPSPSTASPRSSAPTAASTASTPLVSGSFAA